VVVVTAPSTQLVLDFDGPHWASGNIPFRQVLPAGTTITWGWTSGAQSSGADGFDADLYDVQTGTPVSLRAGAQLWSTFSGTESFSVTLVAQAEAALLLEAGGMAGHHSAGTLYGFHAEVAYAAPAFCQYGGQNDPSKALTFVVGSAVLDAIVVAALAASGQIELLPYVGTAVAALEGTIPFAVDCTIVPTSGAVLDLTNPSTLNPANLSAWLKQAAWGWFCECVPAPAFSPPPLAFHPPPVIGPPHVTNLPAPTIICDSTDICSYLNHLEQLIAAIGTQVSYLRADVQLIQRQGVPFGYVPGAVHAGLNGEGQFAVSAILGLGVHFTAIPSTIPPRVGDPYTYHGLGKISVGALDGWERSFLPTHNPYLILPVSGAITLVGYALATGVIATITELLREP
jgi:hypothetical protein